MHLPPTITNFPHAEYDPDELNGWLCEYYAWLSIDQNDWRNQSYSPEILNFKDGEQVAIRYFVNAYLRLIEYVLAEHNAAYAYVVPVPASVPNGNAEFTTVPRSKSGRNRDNRNQVFCQELDKTHGRVILTDILVRKDLKPKKARWNAEKHANSMSITGNASNFEANDLLILVDDVSTQGGTMSGAKLLLSTSYDADRIVTLPIAQTRFAEDFRPLRPG